MNDNIYIHLLDGSPAVYDERTQRIFYAGKVLRNFATSYRQLIDERNNAIRNDAKDGVGPYRYGHVRIPRDAL